MPLILCELNRLVLMSFLIYELITVCYSRDLFKSIINLRKKNFGEVKVASKFNFSMKLMFGTQKIFIVPKFVANKKI